MNVVSISHRVDPWSLLKNPGFDVQPLKGRLISKNLRHRWSDALMRNMSFSANCWGRWLRAMSQLRA